MKILSHRLTINLGLLFSGFFSVLLGFLLQVKYHIGNYSIIDVRNNELGMNYYEWLDVHRIFIVLLSIFMGFHIHQHWKLYCTIIRKRLFAKNQQTFVLSIVFVLVALTGFVPWVVHLFGGSTDIRRSFVEIHDKLAIVLFIYLILHLAKRFKWFLKVFKKLNV